MDSSKKTRKIGRRILLLVGIFLIYIFTKNITLNAKITIEPGESVSKILNELNAIEKLRMKVYIKTHNIDFSKLEPGSYQFSGNYSKTELVQKILQGSEKDYLRVTILEGRSLYDSDEYLTKKGYITGGEYIAGVTNLSSITGYQQTYPFLNNLPLKTLEGFLYPDTYNVDKNKDIIKQLVNHQLKNFDTKVRSKVNNPTHRYETMILASILEKEEKNLINKSTVAGIFLKRLEIGMKLDADITLCYGLKTSYTSCTPAVIAENINDSTNKYNTRQQKGLPPTPIANPTRESINAVINPESSDYLYYLHDKEGNIHYGRTLDEHNANKARYLQ